MSYSGLIYAAIVACWAAVLVPRWIRRNEEVEHAREEDAARGVRVLERRQAHYRYGSGHAALSFSGAGLAPDGISSPDDDSSDDPEFEADAGDVPEFDVPSFGVAARRRRRVLMLLVLALAVVSLGAGAGRLPTFSIAVPAVLLAAFLLLARRAAVVEARRRAGMRRIVARRRAEAQARAEEAQEAAAAAVTASGKRIAVLDAPEPAEPADPNAWEPVPVPLPTYLTKAKAEPPVVRKIDLSSPGAWTSGRLNPASSIAMPPPRPAEDDDLPEQRRAVGG